MLRLSMMLILLLVAVPQQAVAADELRVATFSADITPALGRPTGLGFIPVLTTAEHPLLARGVLLEDAGLTCVICTLDLMEVHNESWDFLRERIAAAAGVPVSQVALHCLHQHTAPAISTASQRLERAADDPRRVATAEYVVQIAEKLTNAILQARNEWQPVTSMATGLSQVERVASNRRLEQPDGTIQSRGSSTKSAPQLRELPEGLIDPFVRTVAFQSQDRIIACLHYYASHPQSFYGDGRVSYDVPGIIRKRLEAKTGAFHLYLTGCGGDTAFGKYNDGSPEAREELANRLQSGIEQSIASLIRQPVRPMQWFVRPVTLPLRTDEEFSEAANRRILDNANAGEAQRRKAAIALAWIERVQADHPVEISCLSIGSVSLLHLPGEPFVMYQLAAQRMQPDRFVCVAGYGDCGMGYIGGDRIYTDKGGYEQTYAFAGPCQELLLGTIRSLLTAQQ